ncbi:MAG: 30S ribosomal protein S8 [Planctomycetes bacterium]|nr:30S ribosomal protein S8 [Planctomycetota bacterium]MCC7169150.1 30S ribosomal protein S8 [Planctomycetota bacterium]
MTMTDPVADLLTRIRNGARVRKRIVDIPTSKLKVAIADVLKREGFLDGYELVADGIRGTLRLKLRYDEDGVSAITEISRDSKPGRRLYAKSSALPRVRGGLGVSIVSTPRGVLSDREARLQKVGGEILCSVF